MTVNDLKILPIDTALASNGGGWRSRLRRHYLRLEPRSRQRRFQGASGDAALAAAACRAEPDLILALVHDEDIRGVLEIFGLGNGRAEIGMSVEDAYQGEGHGRRLFRAGLARLAGAGAREAELVFAPANHRMRGLVQSAGGDIRCNAAECAARIDPAVVGRVA